MPNVIVARPTAAPALFLALLDLLVRFYRDEYDGTGQPEEITNAREALADAIVGPDADARTRDEAVDRALEL